MRLTALLALFALSCHSSPTPPAAAAATPKTQIDAPPEPVVPGLPRRLLELADHGDPTQAVENALHEMRARLAQVAWIDSIQDETVVASELLEGALDHTGMWTEAVEMLEAAKPFRASTPPDVAAQLDLILARGLVRMGRVQEALQLTRAQGALIDWRIVGPFANERGGGFDAVYDPEKGVDFDATMRGKERDVSWRPNPAPEQALANIVLHDMLRPASQATAYLATAVRVDQPRDVVLSLGSSGAVKVWHGDTLVHANKVQRPNHRDQDRVVLALHEGWNRLLVKVGVEENMGWLVNARLTELDGRPLSGFTQDSSQAPGARGDVAKSTATAAPSVLERLQAAADSGDESRAREAQQLMTLHHLSVHPDDTAAKSAKKHAEAAAQFAPNDAYVQYLVARANEAEPGETAAEIRHNERLFPLQRVVELDPKHVAALIDLAEFHSGLNPLPRKADEWSRRALEAAPNSYRALNVRADVLSAAGRSAEASRLYDRAKELPEGRRIPNAITSNAGWLRWRGDVAGERKLLEDALRRGAAERPVFDALIALHLRSGAVADVLRVADLWLERAPTDVEFMLSTARSVEYAGATSEARALVGRARKVCPDNAKCAFAMSRLAQRDDDLVEADRWLTEVLRLDSGYDMARRQKQLLLEQGQDRFENPYRWDATERVDAARTDAGSNEKVSVVDRTTIWRVNPDGSEHMYEHVLLKVENSGGVKDLDNYWIAYPDDSTLQVYNVRVVHGDKSFERAPPPRGRDGSYSGQRVRFFDLPPLEVGDFVDLEYRIDQKGPDVFGQYFGDRHSFYVDNPDPLAPVARAELIVLTPKDVPIYSKAYNGEALEHTVEDAADGMRAYRWVAKDLKRPTPQTAMPDRIEWAPTVDVSTYESWEAFSSWWWHFIEKEFVTTPEMRAKVQELTAGLTDEMDKVRAIARFVGQEIRYNAWSFGTHGYEPYSAATIFERRFGDCKDKSILLRQMLAEIGVKAHPVLINAQYRRPEEQVDIAMVGHFNHCIAYVPAHGEFEGYYLDATADRDPIEYLRADDQGAKVLHVDDASGDIHRIDYTPAAENAAVREYAVALETDGRAQVRMTDSSVGQYGVQLRYQFGGEKGDVNKRVADVLAEAFGKVDVSDVKTSDLEDIGVPAKLEASFSATNMVTRDGAGPHLQLTFDDIPILDVAREPAKEREWELVLDRPFELRSKVVYQLPEGLSIGALPPDAKIEAPGLIDYSLTTRKTERGIEVERTFTLKDRRVPTDRYADFQDALREIQNAENRTIVLREGLVEASSKEQK